jgi:hypothetical protein
VFMVPECALIICSSAFALLRKLYASDNINCCFGFESMLLCGHALYDGF